MSIEIPEFECECEGCQSACKKNPGWPTPEEANQALDAGLADQYMLDWWEDFDEDTWEVRNIYIICPASKHHDGGKAPEVPEGLQGMFAVMSGWCKGECVLYKDGKCSIHTSGFKPVQCRQSGGCKHVDLQGLTNEEFNYETAKLWDTDEGREVVEKWKSLVNYYQ